MFLLPARTYETSAEQFLPVCLCDLDERAAITSVPDVPTSPHSTSVVPNAGEAEEVEEDYQTALTSHRDSIEPNTDRPFASSSAKADFPEDEEETEELALGMSDLPAQTPRPQQPDSPTPDQVYVISPTSHEQAPIVPSKDETPKPNRVAPSLSDQGAGVRRRSTGGGAGKKNKALGDTDSEGEHEPGYATVLKS